MSALLRYFSLRYALKHPFRILLSVTAVALGVALFVSSDTSNHSIEQAFRQSNDRLRGGAQLHVSRGRMIGVETSILEKLDALPGVKAAPVMQLSTTLPSMPEEGTLLILAMDFKRETGFRRWSVAEGEAPQIDMMSFAFANGVVVTRRFADRHGLKLGSEFPMDAAAGVQKARVGAILKDEGAAQVYGGALALMDLRTAQRLFDRQGKADRIEIMTVGDIAGVKRTLEEALGPEYVVEPPPEGNSFLDDALSRVKALMGISVIALLVAVFIIYNSVSISVVQRVKEIGTLRAMGATRAQIFGAILTEWSFVGLAGSAAGLALGFLLANAFIAMTAKEVNQVISIVKIEEVVMHPRTLPAGVFLGIATTLLAAYFPARAAMRVKPIELLRQGLYRAGMKSQYFAEFWAGCAMIAASSVVWWLQPTFRMAGLGSAVVAFAGAAFVLPQLSFWVARAARPVMGRLFNIEAHLAADNISKFPQRTALTVIALAGALAMMISASALVLSFKVRGERWMDVTFPFDCSVNATDLSTSFYSNATFPEEAADKVKALPEVDFTYGVRSSFQEFRGRTIMMVSPELDLYRRMQAERGMTDFIPEDRLPALLSGEGVAVSENLMKIHRLEIGDEIEIRSLRGTIKSKILGSIEDYSWPQGVVFLDRRLYKKHWEDSGLTYLNIKLKKGVRMEDAKAKISEVLKGTHNLFIYDVRDLKTIADTSLSQTLKFTNIQVGVAIFIGFLGIVNTLLISVMHRMRELALLRAIGMTRRQLVRMVVIESMLLALVAGFVGVFLGLVGAKWPLALHVFQLGGFLMPLAIPWGHVASAIGASLVIGFLASFVPARRAAAMNVLEAIGYE